MKSFLYNYANGITIINGELMYIDSLAAFSYDCNGAGLSLIDPVPDNVYEFLAVDSQKANDSYAKTRQWGQQGFAMTGKKPDYYFPYIDSVQRLIYAKQRRTFKDE